MRKLILSLSLVTGLFVSTASADMKWSSQNPNSSPVNTLTEGHAKNFFHLISNLPWTEEGLKQEKGKVMYVLYFPECPASKDFYKETRKILDQVTIRWIPFTGDDHIAGLYETRTPEALKTAFTKEVLPKVVDKKVTETMVNSSVLGVAMFQAAKVYAPDGNMYFPTVIYGDENNAWVSISPDVDTLVKKIPETTLSKMPLMVEKAKVAVKLLPVKKPINYQNTKEGFASVMLFPAADGIRIAGFDKTISPLPVAGYTEDGYVAIDALGKQVYMYVQDPEFVKANFKGK